MRYSTLPQSILAYLGDGLFSLDPGGRVVYLNPAGEKLLKISAGKLIGKQLASLLDSSSAASLERQLAGSDRSGKLEVRLARNARKVLEFSISPLKKGKKVTGFGGIIRDLTEMKSSFERVSQLAAVLESIRETVIITDHNRRIIYANPAIEQMLGYRPVEMINRPTSRFFKDIPGNPPDLSDYIESHSDERGWEEDIFNRRKDGKIIPVHLTMTRLLDRQGEILGYVGISYDISKLRELEETRRKHTERVEAEVGRRTAELHQISQDLAGQRARLDAILANMAEGVVVESKDYEVVFMNKTLVQQFGDQVGRKCYRAFIGRDSPCPTCGVKAVIKEGKDYFCYEAVDLRGRHYELVATPLVNFDGHRLVIEIVRDITERKKTEEIIRQKNLQLTEVNQELKKLVKVKSEFLSLVSHELKSPLTVIQGYLTLLKDKQMGSLNAEQEEGFKVAATEAEHLNYLINQLLDIAHFDSGRFELQKENFDIKALVEYCVAVLKEKAGKNQIAFKVRISSAARRACGDVNKIKQVFRNVLDNALRLSPNGGEIVISGEKKDKQLHFSIRDEGIGIPEAELTKIFDRFYQVRNPLTMKYGGLGLGLTITKNIVELHGGKIWVESKVGRGTRVGFTLPISGD